MNSIIVGIVVFTCTFTGVLLGMWLRTVLPAHHLETPSSDTIKVGIGLIATMTALVLGLITASSKSSFDTVDAAVRNTAVDILTLDRILARYGTETGEIRSSLKRVIERRVDAVWPQNASHPIQLDPLTSMGEMEQLAERIRSLTPHNDSQKALQSRALDGAEALLKARWMVMTEARKSIPLPFLAILLFWLTITFTSFGLFAPKNATVLAVLFVCSLSVSSAIFLVLEMESPFDGLLRVSADPLRYAVAHLNQ